MIRMIQSKSAGHAKAYFSDALAKSDYYTNDQELTGFWQGRLAARLGLQAMTDKDTFFALCDNLHPLTGEPLTPLTREDRTTGYDINFHCPKSVSILHMLSKDNHILNAFQESVTETMLLIEADGKTRVRKGGVNEERSTSELAWAQFIHQTARPVEGFAPDPHLHSHCFVFNATWDDTEKEIKACQFRDIKRDMPYYQAVFHKQFSDKLMDLGYGIRKTDKSFEIEGVPQRVVNLFCKRTDEIGRIAKEKGITDATELDKLGAQSRAKKQKGTSMEELKATWIKQIEDLGKGDEDEGMQTVRYSTNRSTRKITPQQCIDQTLLHCYERASVIPERRLLANAYRFGLGYKGISVKNITQELHADDRIINLEDNGQKSCTTKEVLKEEMRMVNLAKAGKGKMLPLYDKAPEMPLTGGQLNAACHVLTTSDQVSIVRGVAGAGKTTMMQYVVPLIEKAGKQVIVVAPTARASRGELKAAGFNDANTVAKLLSDPKMQEKLIGQVLLLDEAGLLGTKDMLAILQLVSKNHASLILCGDTRQHSSVDRGDALRILNKQADIRSAEVSKIYRQQNEEYRAAVIDLSQGNVSAAFDKLEKMEAIKEIDPLKPNEDLVNDYIKAVKAGKTTLVIAPTHAQGEEVTKDIRIRLRAEGLLGKKEITIRQFKNLNLTEAEKQDFRNFDKGQLVQFNQNAKGILRGSMWLVEHIDQNQILIKNAKGGVKPLPTDKSKHYDLFTEENISLSAGDRLRITKNGFDEDKKRLDNGDILDVVSVSKNGNIILRNPISKMNFEIPQSFGHLAHAHCITSHASQGSTVQEVFISQPAATFPATDAKQFYVSVSRGKERVHIYTDDMKELLLHAKQMRERLSALEAVSKHHQHLNILMQLEKENQMPPVPQKSKQQTITKEIEEYELGI